MVCFFFFIAQKISSVTTQLKGTDVESAGLLFEYNITAGKAAADEQCYCAGNWLGLTQCQTENCGGGVLRLRLF